MKAILIKSEDEIGRFYALSGDNLPENYTLSKQNCDEIFGVVEVEKLAEKEYPTFNLELNLTTSFNTLAQVPFINGFNKAMELNKEKLFTLEDMVKARNRGDWYSDEDWDNYIESLQQPTIVVVIEMEDIIQLKKRAGGLTNMGKPKLDSNGNLILRKL
jgi:hypothetical protein